MPGDVGIRWHTCRLARTGVVAARPAASPPGLAAAAHHRIRADKIDPAGVITIRCTTAASTTSASAAGAPEHPFSS